MGCGSSASRDVQSSHCHAKEKTKQVHIEKGSNVKLRGDSDNIVFVFGGPGSGKGKIISELLEELNNSRAELISSELLILDQLPHKVSNAIKLTSTKDVTDLLHTDPSHVTLQWILSLVEQHIRHHDNTEHILYLVDLLPNLQCMVNNNISQDCHTHIAQFEAKLPISFTLCLTVSENDLHTSHHNILLPQGATIGDEADNSRTKQRFLSYQKLVSPFLKYFKDNGCLVTVDVSSGEPSCVKKVINNLFVSDNVTSPWQSNNAVLVFALNGMIAGNLDLSQVPMATTVTMAPLVMTANSMEDELRILLDQLQAIEGGVDYIIINTEDTKLTNQNATQFSKQAVMFHDVKSNGHSTPCQKLNDVAMTTYFKSFYSKGKTLLFPIATSDHFCEIVSCYLSNN